MVEEIANSEEAENATAAVQDETVVSDDAGPNLQFLTFTLGDEEYGVDIMKVREIRGWADTTRLPNSPQFMKGVINLRGIVIPIFDLRSRFAMGDTEPTEKHVVIVLTVNERTVGILVDTVSDIVDKNASHIKPAPKMEQGIKDEFVGGLISEEDRMIVLLEVEKLFDKSIIEAAQSAVE